MPNTKNAVGPYRLTSAKNHSDRHQPAVAIAAAAALLLGGCQMNESRLLVRHDDRGRPYPQVLPAAETDPVESSEDAADDAVIIADESGQHGWIVGADKRFGLRVYTLDGAEVFTSPVGNLNNVDAIRTGPGEFLLAGSNRSTDTLDLFTAIIKNGRLAIKRVAAVPFGIGEPYGLCAALLNGVATVFVGDTKQTVGRWSIGSDFVATKTAFYEFDSHAEGCVVDEIDSRLYVAEEKVGIWAVDLASGERRLVAPIERGLLTADVEGLSIYDGDVRLLLASSQGSNSFVAYRLPDVTPVARFRIGFNDDLGIDGASDTDGIAIYSKAVGPFVDGLLVAQDGYNPESNQNFKIVDWREVAAILDLDPARYQP